MDNADGEGYNPLDANTLQNELSKEEIARVSENVYDRLNEIIGNLSTENVSPNPLDYSLEEEDKTIDTKLYKRLE